MDRLDAMKVFVTAFDEGSLVGAGRKLRRSPAAVSRAISFLEQHVGAELFHRTTRSLKLSEAGQRYIDVCRRVLADLDEANLSIAGERSSPRGILSVTAPVFMGETVLCPVIDAFLDLYPAVSVRLYLLDRYVNLIEDGVDVALRIGHLADSSLIATRVGEIRQVVVAAPRYLSQNPRINEPADLEKHRIITFSDLGTEQWTFPPLTNSTVPRIVNFQPKLTVNSIRGAIVPALNGRGITRVLSYHVPKEVREGALEVILKDHEPAPVPVHLVLPQGRLSLPKVRAFVDLATPRLRSFFSTAFADIG